MPLYAILSWICAWWTCFEYRSIVRYRVWHSIGQWPRKTCVVWYASGMDVWSGMPLHGVRLGKDVCRVVPFLAFCICAEWMCVHCMFVVSHVSFAVGACVVCSLFPFFSLLPCSFAVCVFFLTPCKQRTSFFYSLPSSTISISFSFHFPLPLSLSLFLLSSLRTPTSLLFIMSESRADLIAWVNDLLSLSYTKIEQLGTGTDDRWFNSS